MAADPKPFAKIVIATGGEQVLFYKSADEEYNPCLRQVTEIDGAYAEMNLSFAPDDWAALDKAFEQADVAMADAIRLSVSHFFEDSPA